MKVFSRLFTEIDQTTSTNDKVDALANYFKTADAKDAIWCVALLTGNRPKRTIRSGELRDWCCDQIDIPAWLMEESYHVVGDLAETITLLLPEQTSYTNYKLSDIINDLRNLQDKTDAERKAFITNTWLHLSKQELFIFNKLITGSFRMGVSDKIVIRALAKTFDIDENIVAHRLSGHWDADSITLPQLLTEQNITDDLSKPYPFYLAYPLEAELETLGDIDDWFVERKYDGIRGQIIIRDGSLFVWSRGEDLMTDKFVEFHGLVNILPGGTVIDGEIIPLKDEQLLPFHVMQTRIGRKNVTKKTLQDAPLVMICYDLLEYRGADIRELPMKERREILTQLLNEAQQADPSVPLQISPFVYCESWQQVADERTCSRDHGCEGLMLKKKDSAYKTGRKRGDWWKWKVDPLSIDGVMIYAQRGHGRRANLYTDFTFAVWDGDELVPFAKAYSGLTDKELVEVDNWIKKNTQDKFGPVRSVTPKLVFEIGFEGINPSPRHKSGIALRFPRILRWRQDKSAEQANTKEDLQKLLNAHR